MKTNLLTTALLFISVALFAQNNGNKTILLDSLRIPTTDKNYAYIRIVEDYKSTQNLYTVSEYYKSGKLSMKAFTKNKDNLKLEGLRVDYYENGNKKQESNYIDNNLNGKELQWYENGNKKSEKEITWDDQNKNTITKIIQFWNKDGQQTIIDSNGQYETTEENLYEKGEIKNGHKQGVWEGKNLKENYSFSEVYNEGKFISGISTDTNNNKLPYKELMTKPTPAKGIPHFYQHIGRNYKTPKTQGLSGKVYLSFVVDKDGSLTDFRILRDLGYGTGVEGIRVIASYGNWIPGKMRGMPAKVSFSIPISIKAIEGNSNSNNTGAFFKSEMKRVTNNRWQ
ncbi:hypothetical protein GCM10008015_25690 [Flavobacterium palustre]|uniref:Energy transducer TonB n=1 Tax=Flavobacterium palustre TaxID=1476463 RepID=A0ABQ1HP28_9FLAO|nr:energy transducer TonB [Flavobacterium palustre]GGA83704.1 hypothetical protein GCM10008015_25690 [Flavobacterium palustre]